VGVDVDEARGDDVSAGIDFLRAGPFDFADGADQAIVDGNVADNWLSAGAVYNCASTIVPPRMTISCSAMVLSASA
jgi:hypothetical protein